MSRFTVSGIPVPTPVLHKSGYRIGNVRNNIDYSDGLVNHAITKFYPYIRFPKMKVALPLLQTSYVADGKITRLPFDKYKNNAIEANVSVFYCTSVSTMEGEDPKNFPRIGDGSKEHPFTNLIYAFERLYCLYMQRDDFCCNEGIKLIVDGVVNYPFNFTSDMYRVDYKRPFIFDVTDAHFSIEQKQPEFLWGFPSDSYIENMQLKLYLNNVKLSVNGGIFYNSVFDISGNSNGDTRFSLWGLCLYNAVISIKTCSAKITAGGNFYLDEDTVEHYDCGIYNTSIKGTFSRNQESSSLYIDGYVMYSVNTEVDCIKDHFGFRCEGAYGYNVQVKLVAEAHIRNGILSFIYAENVSGNFQNLLYNGDSYGLYLGTGINCHSTVTCGVNSHSIGMGVRIGKDCSSSISYNDYESKIQDMCPGSKCEQNMCYTRLCPDGTRFLKNSIEAPICAYDDGMNPVLYNCKAIQPAVVYETWIKEGWKPSTPEEYFASGTIVKHPVSNDRCYTKVD